MQIVHDQWGNAYYVEQRLDKIYDSFDLSIIKKNDIGRFGVQSKIHPYAFLCHLPSVCV